MPHMQQSAGGVDLKSFNKPDEIREFPKGRLELVKSEAQLLAAPCSSLAGVGRNQFSPLQRRKAARLHIFSIMLLAWSASKWMTARSLTASRAMFLCSVLGMMLGSSETKRWSSSISREWSISPAKGIRTSNKRSTLGSSKGNGIGGGQNHHYRRFDPDSVRGRMDFG